MPKRLSVSAQNILDSSPPDIKTWFDLKLNNQSLSDVISYSISYDRGFGAAGLSFQLNNDQGIYSQGGSNPVKFGDKVELWEGMYNSQDVLENFKKFTGSVRQTSPETSAGISRISVSALDYIIKLEDLDCDLFLESLKTAVLNLPGMPTRTMVKLRESEPKVSIQSWSLGRAWYFDFGYWTVAAEGSNISEVIEGTIYYWHPVKHICPTILPSIMVRNTGHTLVEPLWEGFQVSYEQGQVILGTGLDLANYELWAIFYYYKESDLIYAEDVIKTIITQKDGYDKYFFTDSNLQTTLLEEDGVSSEDLIPNYSTMTIEGTDYSPGRCWYHSYNNFITDMSAANYTVPDGYSVIARPYSGAGASSLDKHCKRYGFIILNLAVPNPQKGDLKCNVSYSFWTLQATGVRIPLFDARVRTFDNRFQALEEIRKLIQPNYILRTKGEDKIWGSNLRQKLIEDFTLKTETSLSYAQSPECYTRVKAFGENAIPINVMLPTDTGKLSYDLSSFYTSLASQQPLSFVKTDGDWVIYELPLSIINEKKIVTIYESPKIKLYVNDIQYQPNPVSILTLNNPTSYWGKITKTVGSTTTYVGFWFNRAIFENTGIIFYVGSGSLFKTLKFNEMYKYYGDVTRDGVTITGDTYKWFPGDDPIITNKNDWSTIRIESISLLDFNLYIYGRAKYEKVTDATGTHYYFKVAKGILPEIITRSEKTISNFTNPYGLLEYQERARDGIYCADGTNPGDYLSIIRKGSGAYPTLEIDFGGYVFLDGFKYSALLNYEHFVSVFGVPLSDTWMYYANLIESVSYWDGSTWQSLATSLVSSIGGSYYHSWKSGLIYFNFIRYYWVVREHSFGNIYTNKIKIRFRSTYGEAGELASYLIEIDFFGYDCPNVKADFWYQSQALNPPNLNLLNDGLPSTQLQVLFGKKPVSGLNLTTIEFKDNLNVLEDRSIDAIDMLAGFYIPGDNPLIKYSTTTTYTLKYALSSNPSEFSSICNESTNFTLQSGETKSFESDMLGEEFKACKIAIIIEDVQECESVYPVCLAEFSCWKDIFLTGEAKLIPATKLTTDISVGAGTIYVEDTGAFPSSGIAYIESDDFSYTGKTDTTFTGCSGITLEHLKNSRVSEYLETDTIASDTYTHLYDPDHLLVKLGDRIYKEKEISKYFNTQEKLNKWTKALLDEYRKNTTKVSTNLLCRPDMVLGDTIKVFDYINGIKDEEENPIPERYFVEGISNNNGRLTLDLAQYVESITPP